jgi:hypothetical protein
MKDVARIGIIIAGFAADEYLKLKRIATDERSDQD